MATVKDLPPFSYPAYKYAHRLTIYFEVLEFDILDIKNKDISKQYAAAITSKLPFELLTILPTKPDLTAVLKCLTDFDSERDTISSIIHSSGKCNATPSLQFHTQYAKLRSVMDVKVDDDSVKEFAWGTVLSTLPSGIRQVVCVLGVKRFPGSDQMERIDAAFFETCDTPGGSEKTVFAVDSCNAVSKTPSWEDRIGRLESQMERLITVSERNACSSGNNSHAGNSATVCKYHTEFGNRARMCESPCAFVQKEHNNYQQNSYPSVRPNFRPNNFSPLRSAYQQNHYDNVRPVFQPRNSNIRPVVPANNFGTARMQYPSNNSNWRNGTNYYNQGN